MNFCGKGKLPVLAALAIIAVIATITAAGVAETSAHEAISVIGTIRYIDIEGGFWGIVGNDGTRYAPWYLPKHLQRPGLKARFELIPLRDNLNIRMWGVPVEILDYKIISR